MTELVIDLRDMELCALDFSTGFDVSSAHFATDDIDIDKLTIRVDMGLTYPAAFWKGLVSLPITCLRNMEKLSMVGFSKESVINLRVVLHDLGVVPHKVCVDGVDVTRKGNKHGHEGSMANARGNGSSYSRPRHLP